MPLKQALRVRETAFLLRRRRRGQKENFSLDRFWIGSLRTFVPVARALDLEPITNDEPVEFLHCFAMQLRVRRTCRGVLTEEKQSFHFPLQHADKGRQLRV